MFFPSALSLDTCSVKREHTCTIKWITLTYWNIHIYSSSVLKCTPPPSFFFLNISFPHALIDPRHWSDHSCLFELIPSFPCNDLYMLDDSLCSFPHVSRPTAEGKPRHKCNAVFNWCGDNSISVRSFLLNALSSQFSCLIGLLPIAQFHSFQKVCTAFIFLSMFSHFTRRPPPFFLFSVTLLSHLEGYNSDWASHMF